MIIGKMPRVDVEAVSITGIMLFVVFEYFDVILFVDRIKLNVMFR